MKPTYISPDNILEGDLIQWTTFHGDLKVNTIGKVAKIRKYRTFTEYMTAQGQTIGFWDKGQSPKKVRIILIKAEPKTQTPLEHFDELLAIIGKNK